MTNPRSAADFLQRAVELGFLTPTIADELARESQSQRETPANLGLQRGLISTEQIDIIQAILLPRETAPGYEIVNLLGYGGMGVVYRARQLALNREVALKTILLGQLGQGKAAERFTQEAATIGRLIHPHIITAYDFGNHAGRLFLAMELVDGIDADSWIRKTGPLDEATTWQIVRQTAAGLSHAAQLGVVHRDIKPANLLLVEPPAGFPLPTGLPLVKIADFGLAMLRANHEMHTRITTNGAVLGSPHYMAPEQFDAVEVDHRADIYALGATAFHLLAGVPPWANLNLSQVMGKKLLGDIPSLKGLREQSHAGTEELLAAMLATNPAQRPQTYPALMERIDGLLEQLAPSSVRFTRAGVRQGEVAITQRASIGTEKTELLPPKTTPSLHRFKGRRWWWLGAVAAILYMVIQTAMLWPERSVPRDCQPMGAPVALFNGKSLEPPRWSVASGQWSPEISQENGFVLSGEAPATIIRRVLEAPPEVAFWKTELVIEPATSDSVVEVEFDLPAANSTSDKRWGLRLESTRFSLGQRAADSASWHAAKQLSLRPDASRRWEVQIERHSAGWWIQVGGQSTSIAALHPLPSPEFRLSCIAGKASFFDLLWQEMERE